MSHAIIAANRYLTLATCNNNEVWAATLCYVYCNKAQEFYFYSALNSVHAKHIAFNPNVSVCIYDSQKPSEEAEGLQMSAKAEMVGDDALEEILDFYFEQSFADEAERRKWLRPPSDFKGSAPQRFYKIKPIECYINNVDENMIDYRRKINIF